MTRRIEKPWGHEVIWSVTDRYAGKLLAITAGHRLSLQAHERKEESIMVLSGVLHLELHVDGVDRSVRMVAGDAAHIPTGAVHRFEAIEDCLLVEVSTPELDDVIRFEDDYGRQVEVVAA